MGVALSASTAAAYKYSVVEHLSFGAPKCGKAQKSSGFWAFPHFWLCIKDNVLIETSCAWGLMVCNLAYTSEFNWWWIKKDSI